MSISDTMMLRYYELLTSRGCRALFVSKWSRAQLHPMEAKKRLAHIIVARFYDGATADRERASFEQRFQRRELPENLPRYTWDQPTDVVPSLPRVVTASGIASSMSEARRLIQQGAVRVDGERIEDPHFVFPPTQEEAVVQVGPRRVVRHRFSFRAKTSEGG